MWVLTKWNFIILQILYDLVWLSGIYSRSQTLQDVKTKVRHLADKIDYNLISQGYFLPWMDLLFLLRTCSSLLHFQFLSSPTAAPAGFPARRLDHFTVPALDGVSAAGPDRQDSWIRFSGLCKYLQDMLHWLMTQKIRLWLIDMNRVWL